MRTIEDIETQFWLLNKWDYSFDWDQFNLSKLEKHGLVQKDVESIFLSPILFGGYVVPPDGLQWDENRYILFGSTHNNKKLALIWTKRNDSIRPITCRSMRENEKKQFDKEIAARGR